jgi:hypothetical protein
VLKNQLPMYYSLSFSDKEGCVMRFTGRARCFVSFLLRTLEHLGSWLPQLLNFCNIRCDWKSPQKGLDYLGSIYRSPRSDSPVAIRRSRTMLQKVRSLGFLVLKSPVGMILVLPRFPQTLRNGFISAGSDPHVEIRVPVFKWRSPSE